MGTLAVLPSLRAVERSDGKLVLTTKFIDGMLEYCRNWDGEIRVLLEPAEESSVNLDNVEVDPGSLPFSVELVQLDAADFPKRIEDCEIGYGWVNYRQHAVSRRFLERGVPFVCGSENSLASRLQALVSDGRDPLRVAFGAVRELREESVRRAGIRLARGIQCNGTPTYEAYKALTPSALLFFDTRLSASMQVTRDDLEQRVRELESGSRPLRLTYTGRLAASKGALDTIEVAKSLKEAGVAFELSIFGGGPLETSMRERIESYGLASQVSMGGVLDFKERLVPWLRRSADLFVCCHHQADPSCTYLETLGCGVPIVSYANAAFSGILARARVGATTRRNRPRELARLIAELAADRRELAELARNAIRFAAEHDFETTFRRRIEHLRSIARP